MTLPDPLESVLEDEDVAARISLSGEDELVVTPTRSLRYEADGLLSDESVQAFPHEASTLTVSSGRRKSRLTLTYPLEGERSFTVPTAHTDEVLLAVLAGVLAGNDVTEPGESVLEVFRFSELTVVVTSHRLVKHVGAAVWDEEYETIDYDAVSAIELEEGSVSSQVVLTVDGRQERIKAPAAEAEVLAHHLEEGLRAHHDVESLSELDGDTDAGEDRADPVAAFDSAVTPLSTGSETSEAAPDHQQSDGDLEGQPTDDELAAVREELAALEARIDEQIAALEDQRASVKRLREQLEP